MATDEVWRVDHIARPMQADPPKLRIALKSRSAAGNEVEHPRPLLVGELFEGMRAARFGKRLLRIESSAHCQGDQMLR